MTESTSAYQVDVRDEFGLDPDIKNIIRVAVTATLKNQRLKKSIDLAVLLTSDKALHRLNRDFLGIDEPTDVLSFPSGEELADQQNLIYLGDIAVSVPRARQQAQQAGHSFEDELRLLIVHATLHLLGYDHAADIDKNIMWSKQKEILISLDSGIVAPYEEEE